MCFSSDVLQIDVDGIKDIKRISESGKSKVLHPVHDKTTQEFASFIAPRGIGSSYLEASLDRDDFAKLSAAAGIVKAIMMQVAASEDKESSKEKLESIDWPKVIIGDKMFVFDQFKVFPSCISTPKSIIAWMICVPNSMC